MGLLLRGIEKDEVERGQVIAKPGSIKPHKKFKGEVYVLSEGRGRAAHAVLQGIPAAVLLPDDGRDGSGGVAGGHRDGDAGRQRELEVELITPVAMDKGLRFAIREGGRTVGAGTVTRDCRVRRYE